MKPLPAKTNTIGLVKMRCADAVTLFSSHAIIYSYVGCPLCGGAAIVTHSICPIHTNSCTPQVKAIGLLEDSGVLSIAVATSPPSSQTLPVDCDLTDVANGPPAAGAPSASSNNASVSGLQSLAQIQLNDNALVHVVVIVAHASEQRDQWFNEGPLKTYLCKSVTLGNALRNEKYRVTQEDWNTFVNVYDLKKTEIRDEVAILHVWGTCALWKKINTVRPPEA